MWPEGKLASTGRLSRRWTGGRSRWTTSVVARYEPDSTQITKRVNAARSQERFTRNTTSSTPTTAGITRPPASVDPTQERSVRPGLRRSASQRLTSLSHFSKPRFGTSSSVSRRPAAIVSADQQRVAGDDGRQEDANGMRRAEPTGNALGRRSGRGLEDLHAARLLRLAGRRVRRRQRGERYDLGRRVRRIHAGLFTPRTPWANSSTMPLLVLSLVAVAGGTLVTLLACGTPRR